MHVNALAAAITRVALNNDEEAVKRFKNSVETLISIARQIRYDFNDQGYDFENRRPYTNKEDFRQPDTVGAYAYIMQMAYETFRKTGTVKRLRKPWKNICLLIRTHGMKFQAVPWHA